jgi:hypothetical protein
VAAPVDLVEVSEADKVRQPHYDGLPGNFSFTLALSAWGWHMETAIHVLRLVLSGALDRHPRLQIVIGHMGEAIPFMLDRIDETTATEAKSLLRRSVRQTILDHVWITTSGFFTMAPFMAALMTFGVVRGRVLEVEREPRCAIDLQLFRLGGPRERPTGVDPETMQTDDRGEAWVPAARGGNGQHIDGMGKVRPVGVASAKLSRADFLNRRITGRRQRHTPARSQCSQRIRGSGSDTPGR